MRFDMAWGRIASENYILKVLVLGLFILTLFFGITTLKLSTQGALVIERSCYSKALQVAEDKHSKDEIDVFLRESLNQRFNSNLQMQDGFISAEERRLKEDEQKEMKSRGIEQSFLYYSYIEKDGEIHVNADRVIRVGEVRSAFKFPLIVKIESRNRTTGNPYGLVLVKTVVEKEDEGKK